MNRNSLARIVVASTLALAAQLAHAATSTTIAFPDLGIFESFASQPFDPIDPAAQAVDVHVTGTWTFDFAHSPGTAPYSGGLYFGATDLAMFFLGPHGNDGLTFLDTQVGNVVTLEGFTGTSTYVITVDKTIVLTANQLQNVTGPGTGTAFIEGPVASWLPFDEAEPGSIYLADGSVTGLTITLTAVPEPAPAVLLAAALGVFGLASRRARRTA